VLWNAHAPALWRRTTVYVRRALARHAGLSRAETARRVRVSYVKVAEFQTRGLIHFHAVARLDGIGTDGERVPPPEPFTAALLAAAIRDAVAVVTVPYPSGRALFECARWGAQVDVREIANSDDAEVNAGMVAAYIAKYATKSASTLGTLDRPLNADDIEQLRVSDHVRALVKACWCLGSRPEHTDLHLRRWAHMLGFGGHWGTKSRAYSTTFAALRQARAEWAAQQHGDTAGDGVTLAEWRVAGIGYKTGGDLWLADTARRNHAESAALARAHTRETDGGTPPGHPTRAGSADELTSPNDKGFGQ
jgi:hypothetical protein